MDRVAQRYPVAGNDTTNIHESRRVFMNTQAHGMTRHDLEAQIAQRSWEDAGFRNELMADPAEALGKYLQVPVDRLPKIVAHEETAGTWHIVLPSKTASALSDADLERVAGGATPMVSTVVVASAAAGGAAAGSAALTPTTAVSALVVSYVTISVSAISAAEGGW
jgi:hypothetical protein